MRRLEPKAFARGRYLTGRAGKTNAQGAKPCSSLKSTLTASDTSVASLYDKTEAGKFRLKVDGVPQGDDTAGLKKKVDELLAEKKAAAAKAKEAEEMAARPQRKPPARLEILEALDKSWNQKYTEALSAKDNELNSLRGTLNTLLVDNVATNLANELAIARVRRAVDAAHQGPTRRGNPRRSAENRGHRSGRKAVRADH